MDPWAIVGRISDLCEWFELEKMLDKTSPTGVAYNVALRLEGRFHDTPGARFESPAVAALVGWKAVTLALRSIKE